MNIPLYLEFQRICIITKPIRHGFCPVNGLIDAVGSTDWAVIKRVCQSLPGAKVTESLSAEGEGEVGSTPMEGRRRMLGFRRSFLQD